MIRIYAIAVVTFIEAVRNKIVWAFAVLALLSLVVSRALGWVSSGEDLKVMTDVALASMLITGLLIASFVSSHLLYQEEEKKSIYLILSKPVARLEYVLGKWLGLVGVLVLHALIVSSVFMPLFLLMGGEPHPTFLIALGTIILEFMVVIALSLALTSMTSPLFSAVMTFVVALLCHGVNSILELRQFVDAPLAKKALTYLYHVLPNFSNFDYKLEAAHHLDVPINGFTLLYALCWVVLFLACAAGVTQRKQL